MPTPALYRQWAGLRNNTSAERFQQTDLVAAQNVVLDNTGRLKRREGQTLKLSGATHSLWSFGDLCLMVQGTELKQLHADFTATTLRAGLTANQPMSYCYVAGRVYYSNGLETGVVEGQRSRSWGVIPPMTQGSAVATVGDMRPGVYQWAVTYLRGDGQESGTGLAGEINLPDGGGLVFTLPVSDDPDVTHKLLYLSPPNGDVLYEAALLKNSDTTATYADTGVRLNRPLDTQFKQPAPAGHIVAHYRGRMLVAIDNSLFYSDAFGYELFDLRHWYTFDSRIQIVAPTENGIFVATEHRTEFVQGKDAHEFELIHRADYGAVEGTLAYLPARLLGLDGGEDDVAIWTATQGICLGMAGGSLLNLTNPNYQIPVRANGGASTVRTVDNVTHYVTVLNH